MFNVKRNGASVEITDIPQSIPFSVFKDIADKTGATETLVCYFKDKSEYEVTIQQTNENMAGTVAWLVLQAREPEAEDVDISAIGKRIAVMRVKQHMNTQELEEAIGASTGSVFRWETGKAIPSNKYINCLAAVLKCDPQWLLSGELIMLTAKKENDIKKDFRLPKYAIYAAQDTLSKLIIKLDMIEEEPAKKLALVVKKAFTELYR
ncbi:hypothetical protein DOE63_12085 [Salmonella enterica subsp. diarizonae serovar 59:z10:-]|nr:hypothetical protein DOE63_12085 [Salmonella enterica subsp. diarizonae serovar 59:z10:-]